MTEPQESGADIRRRRAMVRAIMINHFGKPPTRIVYKPTGLTNYVFLVNHAEGQFVVRISPDPGKLKAFIKEQWATLQAREAGVPTPEVLEVGNGAVPEPYMIAREVSGTEATFHPNRPRILSEMGRYGAIINSIKTTGFGSTFDWSHDKLSRNETWKEFLDGELKAQEGLQTLEKLKMLTPAQVRKLRAIFDDARKARVRPSLNHGDLRLKNVIVDQQGEISAIVDWEDCISSLAPQWELSIALHDLSIDEKQEFLKGYGLTPRKFSEIAPLIKAFNIINYAPTVEEMARKKKTKELEAYRLRLSGILDLYSV
jgi:aminoglycoside phosphotransferase (APT) family kinase protein